MAKKRKRVIQKKPYKGIRMRKWSKWVAEIREPNKRSRIWIGSYSTPIAAAQAYDIAVYHLRGTSSRLNFPVFLLGKGCLVDLSATDVRKKAIEVNARVDALETTLRDGSAGKGTFAGAGDWLDDEKPNLNKKSEDCEWED